MGSGLILGLICVGRLNEFDRFGLTWIGIHVNNERILNFSIVVVGAPTIVSVTMYPGCPSR